MIDDFDRTDPDAPFEADLCIIGAGAAGITIAREFLNTRFSVILLEGGGKQFEEPSQDPYQTEIVGLPHNGVHKGRVRVLGGTTTWWAGQALPLDAIDFEPRPWVPHSGWPFPRTELEPFYPRAETVMNLPHRTYDEHSWPQAAPSPPPPYDKAKILPQYSQFSRTPNFSAMYEDELRTAPNVRVLLHANCVGIVTNETGGHVEFVRIKSLSGKTGTVRARQYVVCCGGVDTARLLLASQEVSPDGVANDKGLVGRYFQDHVHCRIAPIVTDDKKKLSDLYHAVGEKGVKYLPKFRAGEALQRDQHILNATGEVVYDILEDSPVESAKTVLRAVRRKELRPQVPQALARMAKEPGTVASALFRYYVAHQPVTNTSGTAYLGIGSEQVPNPDSRVRLSDKRDALGMPRTILDWQLTELEIRTFTVFAQTIADEFARMGIGTIDLSNFNLPTNPAALAGHVTDAYHHMGTTRMSDDKQTGVVDSECRTHQVDNLHIGSGAVFPTGGYSNCTLTIIALCLRMADRFKQTL